MPTLSHDAVIGKPSPAAPYVNPVSEAPRRRCRAGVRRASRGSGRRCGRGRPRRCRAGQPPSHLDSSWSRRFTGSRRKPPREERSRTRRVCWSDITALTAASASLFSASVMASGTPSGATTCWCWNPMRCKQMSPCRWWSLCAMPVSVPAATWCRSTWRLPTMIPAGRFGSWRRSPPPKRMQVSRRRARMVIPARAFARFDTEAGGWVRPPGSYTVRVGRSSRDYRLAQCIRLGAG